MNFGFCGTLKAISKLNYASNSIVLFQHKISTGKNEEIE